MAMRPVTDATFEAEVQRAELPVLVEFGTSWCAPCKQLEPVLQEMSVALAGKVRIVTMDVEENPGVASRLGVRGMPSLFLFNAGEVIANRTGSAPKATLRAWIDASLS